MQICTGTFSVQDSLSCLCAGTVTFHRNPTDACHRKARRRKKKGSTGSTSTIGANTTNSSGSLAWAASGIARNAPAVATFCVRSARCCAEISPAGVTNALCSNHSPQMHAAAHSRVLDRLLAIAGCVYERLVPTLWTQLGLGEDLTP